MGTRVRTRTTGGREGDQAPEEIGAVDGELLLLAADLVHLCNRRYDPPGNSADALESLRATLVAWARGTLPRVIAYRNLVRAYDAMRRVGNDEPAEPAH